MGFLNSTVCAALLITAYLSFSLYKLYDMMNPLNGVEVKGESIGPLWHEGDRFRLLCFVEKGSKFSRFRVEDKKIKNILLLDKTGFSFSKDNKELSIELDIVSPRLEDGSSVIDSNRVVATIESPKFWSEVHSNKSSIFLHVVIVKESVELIEDEINMSHLKSGQALFGVVRLIKYDRIPKSFRQRYLLSDFGLVNVTRDDEAKAKLPKDTIISYWKPEVAVRLVTDFSKYPLVEGGIDYMPSAMRKNLVESRDSSSIYGRKWSYKPPVHVDEIGLTSDKYIPLNSTVSHLPLKLSYGPMSLQRWLLMAHMESAFADQKDLGFTDKDIDDVRRLITDTSIYLLAVTIIASILHLLFEFLAFQSDINFWRDNKSLAGLSVRSVVSDLASQIIIFLFLLDSDTSILVTIPSFLGIVIQIWKVKKATGFTIGFGAPPALVWSWTLFGVHVACMRVTLSPLNASGKAVKSIAEQTASGSSNSSSSSSSGITARGDGTRKAEEEEERDEDKDARLTRITLEADRIATNYLGSLLLPITLGMVARSLIVDKHASWYSWFIASLTGSVYAFGFVLMCPQLFINHRLKTVAHLPWKFLIFRFINTFIDDLFAFIIKMPTMHRISVFRDDIVFIIYMYQRWIYRVDESRPLEK